MACSWLGNIWLLFFCCFKFCISEFLVIFECFYSLCSLVWLKSRRFRFDMSKFRSLLRVLSLKEVQIRLCILFKVLAGLSVPAIDFIDSLLFNMTWDRSVASLVHWNIIFSCFHACLCLFFFLLLELQMFIHSLLN